MTISGTPIEKTFSACLGDITCNTSAESVAVVATFAGEEIYNETLMTDEEGNATLYNLADLVKPYARQKLVGKLTITFNDGSSTATVSIEIVYCAALMNVSCEDYTSGHFLSLLQGAKQTAMGRLEYLHYTGTDAATCTAHYTDGTTATFDCTATGGNDNYTTIEVSPSLFVTEGKTLAYYVVTAGGRSQRFDIDLRRPDCAPMLVFVNSFGVEEIIYCTGPHTLASDYKFSSTYVANIATNYKIDETRTFKADTGVLTFPMAAWAPDLFRSEQVRLLTLNAEGVPTVGRDVVLTAVKAEYTNADTEQPRFTFEYTYATRNHNVLDQGKAGRIFDNTFDFTFN